MRLLVVSRTKKIIYALEMFMQEGNTMLTWASYKGQMEVAKYLLAHKANIDERIIVRALCNEYWCLYDYFRHMVHVVRLM